MKQVDPSQATDAELLLRFEQGGDQSAFAELVRRHGPMVFATARRAASHQQDAEDAFQATFFALARAAGKLRRKESVAAWLHRTAYQCAAEIHRTNARWTHKASRMKERLESESTRTTPMTSDASDSGVADEKQLRLLDEEVAKLPQKYQAAVVLCDLEGYTHRHAARQLGIAPSTVHDRVTKGRRLLRQRLTRRGVTVPTATLAGLVAASSESSAALVEPLIGQVAAKAALYAAGKSAAEVGASTAMIHAANTVMAKMATLKLAVAGMIVLAMVTVGSSFLGIAAIMREPAPNGTLLYDSFDDRDHTDGVPATWTLGGLYQGSVDTSSGDLILSPNPSTSPERGVGVGVESAVSGDTSVRSQVRIGPAGGSVAISARIQNNVTGGGYFAGVTFLPNYQNVLLCGTTNAGVLKFFEFPDGRRFLPLAHDVRQADTVIQLDVIGNEVRVYVWREGDPMPAQPLFLATDTTFREPGFVGVSFTPPNRPVTSQGTFRYFHAADVPIHQLPAAAPDPPTARLTATEAMTP